MPATDSLPVPTNATAAALRFVVGLVETGAGDAGGELNLRVRAGGYVVELRPAGTAQGDDGGRETGENPPVAGENPATGGAREVAGQPPAGAGVRPADLENHFLSVSERMILAALAKKPGAKASDVLFVCRIKKSAFWTLWSNLQHRGLVDDADGPDGGFVIAVPWVVELLGGEPLDPKRV